MIDNKNPNGLTRANRSLDALNFFLADVRGGLGPYLAVYLLTVQNWNEAEIGIVMSISAIAGILTETPSGALIDAIHAKRAAVNAGTSLMSACVVAAQLIMVPMAILVGRKANRWGRKPLFLACFLILPIRGGLYAFSDDPYWLVAVQLLDGVGAGLYGALFPLIVADLMEGTGRFNAAVGAVMTAQGIVASLSTTLAGLIVVKAGYSAAFLTLAAIAGAGLALFWLAMPETWRPNEEPNAGQWARQDVLAQAAE